ncbi:thiamine kinase [Rosenbergiella australiborealis]|uniref:thiamine kinase n=1 Tax=Rosenbergiella australiborealis TaxID=1544696 RepID=UPI001F4EE6FA
MKLSGQVVLKPAINPHWSLLPGLSGNSWRTSEGDDLVQRLPPQPPIPFVNRQREYRILQKLGSAPFSTFAKKFHAGVLSVAWVEGEPLPPSAFIPENTELLAVCKSLHRHPLFGYRLPVLPLLQRYWQVCQQRNATWLKILQRLRHQGEPRPLRLVPLHMDLHPGNVIQTAQGLALIDWEYSADGDIALELTTLCLQDPSRTNAWIAAYADAFNLNPDSLRLQCRRWKPWLQLLQASWCQLRAEQTQQLSMQQLAAEQWRQLSLY